MHRYRAIEPGRDKFPWLASIFQHYRTWVMRRLSLGQEMITGSETERSLEQQQQLPECLQGSQEKKSVPILQFKYAVKMPQIAQSLFQSL